MSYKSEQSKRRIEEIKGKALKDKVQFQNIRTGENGWVNTYTLTEDDFNFLVEKVELVEEFEQQNKRYREALEWYSENSPKGNIADEVLEDKKMSVELSEEIRKFLVTHDSEQRELSREQRELSILKQRLQEQRLQDNLNKLEEMSKRHYELIEKFENQNEELTKVNNKNEV